MKNAENAARSNNTIAFTAATSNIFGIDRGMKDSSSVQEFDRTIVDLSYAPNMIEKACRHAGILSELVFRIQ